MKILVCGGRTYAERANSPEYLRVWNTLDTLWEQHHFTHLIEGGAQGADNAAGGWADAHPKVHRVTVRAKWGLLHRGAGRTRNLSQLELLSPGDKVVAFPGGVGTAHMMLSALEAGYPVIEIQESPDKGAILHYGDKSE